MLKEVETWNVHDSTKLKQYAQCPRKYFYKYIAGWRPDRPNNHLVFGAAFHKGMEVLMTDGFSTDAVKKAYVAFEEEYRKEYPDYTDDELFPKTPYMAARAFAAYAETYGRIDNTLKTIHVEVAGSVPLLRSMRMHFKLDTVMQDSVTGLYMVLEHKTADRFSKSWIDQWKTDIQTGAYQHVLNCIYNSEDVWGVKVNGVFFKSGVKKAGEISFERVPVRRSMPMMDDWLMTVMSYIQSIMQDINYMYEQHDEQVMTAFRKNPTACTKYSTCPYHDFCITWPNPLHYVEEVPIGFKVEHWDPRSAAETAKKVVII